MEDGIIVINKADGITSHQVVQQVKRKLSMKRVGHAGTLDPMATGVLIMLLGKSTKLFNDFVAFEKAYRATMVLGKRTTTADTLGEIIEERDYSRVTLERIDETFAKFKGEIQQIPPMYSAVKHKGKRLYELARKGLVVERKPRTVTIIKLEINKIQLPEIEFYLECTKGTYVRQLAEDIGEELGCGGCISQIERTKVGKFCIDGAVNIEELNESHIQRWSN